MMTIGEFAQASGLTVKAVRFYDARGVLVPAATDPHSGYRHYSAEQLRRAVVLGALRRAEVPLPEATRIVDEPDRACELLDRFSADVRAARDRQDAALVRSRTALDLLGAAPEVHQREARAQDWVGLRWRHDGSDEAEHRLGEVMGDEVGALARTLHDTPGRDGEQTVGPASPFWTVYRSDGSPSGVDILLCCAVREVVDIGVLAASLDAAPGMRTGVLCQGRYGAGPEAYARATEAEMARAAESGLPPAAVLALEEHLEEHLEGRPRAPRPEVRQISVIDDEGAVAGFEFVASLIGS